MLISNIGNHLHRLENYVLKATICCPLPLFLKLLPHKTVYKWSHEA